MVAGKDTYKRRSDDRERNRDRIRKEDRYRVERDRERGGRDTSSYEDDGDRRRPSPTKKRDSAGQKKSPSSELYGKNRVGKKNKKSSLTSAVNGAAKEVRVIVNANETG